MNKMIKKGVWIADKKGTYVIADMEDSYIILRDVLMNNKGVVSYGKRRIIRSQDIDSYILV